MRVKRDFDQIYATEEDPWGIGDADSDRYDLYVERILERSRRRGQVLELGCGYGALLARFRDHFDRLVGVEVSAQAVARGERRFPFVEFHRGSLADLDAALPQGAKFDTIVVSDVLYYLAEGDRRAAIGWIAQHLAPDGLAFCAGWSPGGRYLNFEEFRNLLDRELAIESEELLESKHAVFCCRPRRVLVAATVDYETWQPQLEGLVLDWETDALRPTERLLDVFDRSDATLTIFAEMGEYLWLREHRPHLADQMEQQWRDAVRRGHDVQLHLHPNWLPEMEPSVKDGRWEWDMDRTRAADYPGDLAAAIGRCKAALEAAIRPVAPDYEVAAFRAGTYEAQPFDRLYDALVANDIWCDSSVLPGDTRVGRHYDYRHAYADHQPWFASRYDPQLKAPPSECRIVELPVFAPTPGDRWTFDNEQGGRFAAKLLDRLRRERSRPSSEALRATGRMRARFDRAYGRLRHARWLVNRVMPRRLAAHMSGYERERLTSHEYFVMVSHTKERLDCDAIAAGLRELQEKGGVEFVSLSEMARVARAELEGDTRLMRVVDDWAGEARAELERLIPLDRERIIDAELVDSMTCEDGGYDCVRAEGSLERAFDIDAMLAECHRVLANGGCLVAAVTPDGLNTAYTHPGHTWKTIPSELRRRLDVAGFVDVEIESADLFRELGAPPFPPSGDQILYVRAWKRTSLDRLDRVRALTRWAYRTLSPERPQESNDPLVILAGGHAWCWGYVVVLGEALSREGYELRWVTMIAEDHPLGVGERRRDTHEVLEVWLDDGGRVVCDPTVGIVFEASLAELLANPSLADTPRAEDERHTTRNYAMYSTSIWYELVRRVAIRRRPSARLRYVDARRLVEAG